MMKELDIKLSYQCNNACIFCLNKDKRRSGNPFEMIKETVGSFAKNGGEKLIVSGGEPLISEHFFELLIFAKQSGIKSLEIQTNARMLYYENMVRKLKEFEPIGFLVSFHFPNDQLYRKYSQSNGFHQTVQGMKNLMKHDCSFSTNTVIMKPNLPYLKDIIKILKELKIRRSQYRFIDGKNVIDNYKEFVPRYSECLSLVKEVLKENPDIRISLREFPVCVVGEEFKNYLAFCINPGRLNLTTQGMVLTTKKIEGDQFVFPNCENCLYNRSGCSGVRKEYVDVYGIKEFKPIIK
ncbi:MAG: radical SAM protein [Candidatus Nealsonbacteria bacterium]|nr:radical SAM protein [Candidatus Nealsonbacteria bacterium]